MPVANTLLLIHIVPSGSYIQHEVASQRAAITEFKQHLEREHLQTAEMEKLLKRFEEAVKLVEKKVSLEKSAVAAKKNQEVAREAQTNVDQKMLIVATDAVSGFALTPAPTTCSDI